MSYAWRVSIRSWQGVVASFQDACQDAGLDLLHPFALADYNRHVELADRLGDFGRERALGILVGNSRALWPAFTAAIASQTELSANPLDEYVVSKVNLACASSITPRYQSHFSHTATPHPLPVQRLAELVGFAATSPSHLAIHALHGPWLALRAVVVVDLDGPGTPAAEPARPCLGCAAPCVPALNRALSASGPKLDSRSVSEHAAEWIAVRDACPVGTTSRYDEAQLSYHYGVDRRLRHGS